MHRPVIILLALALGSSVLPTAEAELAPPDQPNILFLYVDDQAYDTIAALGNPDIDTPNLDRLAHGGTVFTHAYNQGGWHGALCVASRAMILTGRFLWNAHADERRFESHYVANQLTWPQLLQQAGYHTYFTGKWHGVGRPQQIFQTVRRVTPPMPSDSEAAYGRPPENVPDPWSASDPQLGGYFEGGKHLSEVTADDAIEFLELASDRQPFFMYVAFNAPHDPRQSPRSFLDRYPLATMKLPQSYQPEYPHDISVRDVRDERLAPYPRSEWAINTHRREYYAIISHLDAQIGRILDWLDSSSLRDTTYVFYTSDQGLACGHHGLMGKQNMYDHSVRVPLIIRGPGIEKGQRIQAPVYLQDIMPTTLELAAAEQPPDVEFRSLMPLLRGECSESYRAIYGAYMDTQRMITDGKWKLIMYPKIGRLLLFNLQSDPAEMSSLAENPDYGEKLTEFQQTLRALQQDMGDPLLN